jgi:hypothetical protein
MIVERGEGKANAAQASRPNARMLAHPSGSASPNLPSEAKLLRRISRHFPQIRKHSTPTPTQSNPVSVDTKVK